MNIYALKGHKVRCATFNAGYKDQKLRAINYLEIGKEYTIEETKVSGSSTQVFLQEFPDVYFNVVFFEDVVEQSKEDSIKHPDWARFNEISKATRFSDIKVRRRRSDYSLEEYTESFYKDKAHMAEAELKVLKETQVSLRDQFAMQAMKSMCDVWNDSIINNSKGAEIMIKNWQEEYSEDVCIDYAIAQDAYSMADAMLRARVNHKTK
jgi:hypothetical protein